MHYSVSSFRIVRRMCEGRYDLLHTFTFKADADVFLALAKQARDGSSVCIVKRITTGADEAKVLAVLKKNPSPFLVTPTRTISNQYITLVEMDYYECGTLLHLCNHGLPELQMRFYIAELTLAIDALHQRSILHLDIKPQNVLLDCTGHIALADFGCSLTMDEHFRGQQINVGRKGTVGYQSPEHLQYSTVDEMSDWWGLGVVCFYLLTGQRPFAPKTFDAKIVQHATLSDKLELPPHISEECADFICKLLSRDHDSRLGRYGSEEVMRHPFFQSVDWLALKRRETLPPFVLPPMPLPAAVQSKLHGQTTGSTSCSIS